MILEIVFCAENTGGNFTWLSVLAAVASAVAAIGSWVAAYQIRRDTIRTGSPTILAELHYSVEGNQLVPLSTVSLSLFNMGAESYLKRVEVVSEDLSFYTCFYIQHPVDVNQINEALIRKNYDFKPYIKIAGPDHLIMVLPVVGAIAPEGVSGRVNLYFQDQQKNQHRFTAIIAGSVITNTSQTRL